jgi:hypothetical protein
MTTTLAGLTKKAALVVAFLLFHVACSGGDDFQADPDATVVPEQLPRLVAAAGDSLALDVLREGVIEVPEDDRPSCWGMEVWTNCRVDGGPEIPGWHSSFENEDGSRLTVAVFIGVDAVHARDMVRDKGGELQRQSSGFLRVLFAPAALGDTFVSGPCDGAADRASDAGCAWRSRSTPNVGDSAMAFGSDAVEDLELSALVFARGPVFVEVQAWSPGGANAGREAERLARALDEQIRGLLSP